MNTPAAVAVLDEVLAELGSCARMGQITLKHDAAHHAKVQAARASISELIAAGRALMQEAESDGEVFDNVAWRFERALIACEIP